MTAHQSAAELVAADRRVARPMQTDGHPRLRTAVARHVCLGRIGRHLRIGQAVGRRHALPRPGHRIEIDREPAHAVDVDVGAGGQLRLRRRYLRDGTLLRQRIAGIGDRAAVLVEQHGIAAVGRTQEVERPRIFAGRLARQLIGIADGQRVGRRAVHVVVVVGGILRHRNFERRHTRIGRSHDDAERRRTRPFLIVPLRGGQRQRADAAVADGQPVGGALAIDDFIRIGIAHVARIGHRLRPAGSHEHELCGLGRNRSVGLLTELREFVVGRRAVGRSDRDDHRAAILRVGLQHQFDAVRREIVARAAGRLLEDRRHGRPAHRRPRGRGRNGGLPRHIRNRRPDVDGHGRNEALVPRCGGAVGIEKFHVGIERDPRRCVEAIGAVVVARHRNEQDRTDPCRCFYRRFHVPVELDVYQYQPSVCVRFEFLSRADFEIGHRRMFVLFRFAAR